MVVLDKSGVHPPVESIFSSIVLKTEYESVSIADIKRARNEWCSEDREGADKVDKYFISIPTRLRKV